MSRRLRTAQGLRWRWTGVPECPDGEDRRVGAFSLVTAPAIVIGGGFVGAALCQAYVAAGRPTVLVARRPRAAPPGVELVVDDLTSPARLRDLLSSSCDVVFAAGSSVPADDEVDPAGSASMLGPLSHALAAVAGVPDASFLFISSGGAVYGEPTTPLIAEDHVRRPRGRYGETKLIAEAMVSANADEHGFLACNLRCANAYGPGQRPGRGQGLIAEVLDAVEHGRAVEVWGDGSIERDYVYIGDIVDAIVSLGERRPRVPALNIGSGRGTSVNGVIATVADVVGVPMRVDYRSQRSFDVSRVVLDIDLLRRLIDFEPTSLIEGVRHTWERMATNTVA